MNETLPENAIPLQDRPGLQSDPVRYSLAVKGANDGLWDWDLLTNKLFLSARWRELLGLPGQDTTGTPDEWFRRIHPEDRFWLLGKISTHQNPGALPFTHESRMMNQEGLYRWMRFKGQALWDGTGRATRMAGSMADVTEVRDAAEALQKSSLYDALTGLPKPALFLDRLQGAVDRARRGGTAPPAVLLLNLDRFRLINEGLGHQGGNELLVAVARRLEHCAGPGDTASRFEGDDFGLLLEGLVDSREVENAAERVLGILSAPFKSLEQDIHLTASLGVTWEEGQEDPHRLLENSRDALYRAKALGRNQFQIYEPTMRRDTPKRLRLETELHWAVEHSQFVLHYQPIVSLKKGRITGFEGLVRWRHPARGLIEPLNFIHLAEETGLILPLGQWILEEGCRQLGRWTHRQGDQAPLTISLNLSGRQMTQPGWAERLIETIQNQSVSPGQVALEITESDAMKDPDAVLGDLQKLRKFGCRFSLDDFGTGYSSLSRLHKFPLDCLKVDRSFIQGMDHDGEKAEIVRTVLLLANNLKLEVVAEGIETKGELDLLRRMGCSQGQGYYFSKPLPADEAEVLWLKAPSW